MLPLAFLLIMMCSGVNFFELIQLGVCYASWICKLISFILGHFWAIFFQLFLLLLSFSIFFLGLPLCWEFICKCILILLNMSHKYLKLCSFFLYLFFSFSSSDWIISINLYSGMFIFFCLLKYIEPLQWIFFLFN